MFFCSYVFLCVTSSVSFTGFYTEDEPKFGRFVIRDLDNKILQESGRLQFFIDNCNI